MKAGAPCSGEKGNLRFLLSERMPYSLIGEIAKVRAVRTRRRPRSAGGRDAQEVTVYSVGSNLSRLKDIGRASINTRQVRVIQARKRAAVRRRMGLIVRASRTMSGIIN